MEKKATGKLSPEISRRKIWDCDSTLYDSFELKSFEKQLSSAIASRSMSMPHLSDHRRSLPPPELKRKTTSKISRSIRRLFRSIFRGRNSKEKNGFVFGGGFDRRQNLKEEFYVVYDKSAALSTIPEIPEFDGVSPEISSLVRRTASDRFSVPTSFGIYCV